MKNQSKKVILSLESRSVKHRCEYFHQVQKEIMQNIRVANVYLKLQRKD
jgi:hypothetical protein